MDLKISKILQISPILEIYHKSVSQKLQMFKTKRSSLSWLNLTK